MMTAKVHQKEHFARVSEKWEHVPPVPPIPTSMADAARTCESRFYKYCDL